MVTIAPGGGTPEPAWAAWPTLGRLPTLDLSPCTRAVVLAPHPDDESLAVGGLMVSLLARGAEVVLLAVTDGEASHPGSAVATPDRLRVVRTAETAAALAALGDGLPGRLVAQRLHVPDGGVSNHEDGLTGTLALLLGRGDWCLAPFAGDGHPDHDAAGRAAQAACATTGARLLAYPLWTWHWAVPGDPRVPWVRALRLPLGAEARHRKQAALACYPSQTEPLGPTPEDAAVVPPSDLAYFQRPEEHVFA